MALAPGDRLGPYEVLSQIGAGGMGEVYQAYDSRLERHVAIKVSRDQYTERFTREALAIAALNHTNVCHLYDVGPNYIVLEYVEGANLAGPVPFDQALPLIHQLIDGIEAAHERGIVHRDLKPANIRVTSDGVLKILDFGLAKAATDTTGTDPANSPTLTSPAGTVAGTILGTAAYMSPEQARGRTADRRSDIFAFGVVVYELLTGQGPFAGETAIESMGAVMNREPDWSQVPPRAERLLRWCLEKDRKQRLASISDARRVLAEEPVVAQPVPSARRRTSILPWAVAAAAVLGLAATAWMQSRPVPAPVLQTEISLPVGWDTGGGALGGIPALSPDGAKLVLRARATREDPLRLYLRVLSSGGYTEVPQSEGAQGAAFWSPDSQWVAYASSGRLLKWNPSSAAPPQTIGNADASSGSWGEDGTILFWTIDSNKPLQRIPASGGVARDAMALDAQFGEENQLVPHFLPGGKAFLYQSNGRGVRGATFFATLDGEVRRQLSVDPGGPPQFVAGPDGQGYIVRTANSGQLLAVPFDPEKGEYTGEPRLLADEVQGGPFFSASRTGLLIHAPRPLQGSTLQWYSRSGQPGQVVYENDAGMGAGRISPDGTRIAFVVRSSATFDLFVQESGSNSRQRIDSARGLGNHQWTRDGHVLYGRALESFTRSQLVDRSMDDSAETILGEFPGGVNVQSISADGSLVSFSLIGDGERDAYLISRPGGTARKTGMSADAMLSPDGTWAATVLDGRLSFRAVRTDPDVSLGAEIGSVEIPEGSARWSHDGQEIFLLGRAVHTVPIDWTGDTPSAGTPRKLFDLPDAIGMDVTSDGQRFLMHRSAAATGPQPPLVLTQNWYRLLDR